MPPRQPVHADAQRFLTALRDPGRSLKEKFRGDPIGLAEHFGVLLPKKPVQVMMELGVITEEEAVKRFGKLQPGLRDLVEDVCLLRERSAVAVACRGGGKSKGVSFIEFYLWIILDYDALNLGGSELQAANVYSYLLGYLDEDPYWRSLIEGETKISETETIDKAWIRVLTASQKSVRSPHAGGRKRVRGRMVDRGGLLVIDEEAEAEPEIVKAALPTVNTARPSVSVRCSTFHNVSGTFQEVVDNHAEMGYSKYGWDIFDVMDRCSCVDKCQSSEVCFREDHIEKFISPETGLEEERVVHPAYCGGRGMYASGWIPLEEAESLWKRMKRDHSQWEVEAMGSRPSTSGHVIKDLMKHAENTVAETGKELYRKGAPIEIDVDWGTAAAGVLVWQQLPFGKHALLHADLIRDNNQTQIFGAILGYAAQYRRELTEIACDIGGGGNYLNKSLREDHRLPVRDVNFAEEKEDAVAAWNVMNESGALLIPAEHEDFHFQVKNWRRKSGRIVKHNDHLCDGAVCYFSKFIDQIGIRKVRVPPRSFGSGIPTGRGEAVSQRSAISREKMYRRVSVVRSLGSGTKRKPR